MVTPGNYDGVHLGHRALLAQARATAGETLDVVALFFDPHPTRFFAPDRAQPLLTTPMRRRAILESAGADAVHVERFDHAFSSLSPEQFVDDVLCQRLRARAVIVGEDFRFGKKRAGDVDALRELGTSRGFSVATVSAQRSGGAVVSSTRIRHALMEGRVRDASVLLTRVHDVGGVVVQGDRRGRTIGFPTANLDCEDVLLPSDGVYAVVFAIDGEHVRGVANLGVRPTFKAGRSVEVHLFDFDRDIYGADVRVGFVKRLRGERTFSGLPALIAQIEQDVVEAKRALGSVGPDLLRDL